MYAALRKIITAMHVPLSILILVGVFYGSSRHYGFSQDDWYFLTMVRVHNIGDILNFFNPLAQQGFPFYRPLGTQLYYYLFQGNAGTMHLFMLLLQSANGLLVYRLVKRLGYSENISWYSAMIYCVAPVHFLSLYYIAATQQLLATFFSLLALERSLALTRPSFAPSLRIALLYLAALMSKETAVVVPLLVPVLRLIQTKKRERVSAYLRRLIPFIVVGCIYALIKVLGYQGLQSEYHLVLGPSILTNYRWYYLFAFGIPEELVRFGLPRMGIDLAGFRAAHPGMPWLVVAVALVLTLCASLYLVRRGVRYLRARNLRWLLFVLWFALALAPVVVLSNHLYPHYADLALVALVVPLLATLPLWPRRVLLLSFLLLSFYSIRVSEILHWTTGRAKMAERALATIQRLGACRYPEWQIVGPGPAPRELSYALSLENGPRVICANPELRVYYEQDQNQEATAARFQLSTEGIVVP